MILLDREDVDRIGLNPALFYRRWEVGSPEALEHNYADLPDPGPFLLRVDDEAAWVSRDGEEWECAARRTRYRCPEESHWYELATMYAEAAGMTRSSFLRRITSVREQLAQTPGMWFPWRRVYRWPDGSDHIFDGMFRHPWVETRQEDDRREARRRE